MESNIDNRTYRFIISVNRIGFKGSKMLQYRCIEGGVATPPKKLI